MSRKLRKKELKETIIWLKEELEFALDEWRFSQAAELEEELKVAEAEYTLI